MKKEVKLLVETIANAVQPINGGDVNEKKVTNALFSLGVIATICANDLELSKQDLKTLSSKIDKQMRG